MYLYNSGYYSHEESSYTQFSHAKKFSKKQFENMVIKATLNVLKKLLKEHELKKDEHVSFENIFSYVEEELIKNFGFKRVKFTAKFDVFGWPNILDENDWKGQRDEGLDKITAAIKKNFKIK